MFPISEVLFFASICIFVDITYKGNSNFINPLYDQLKSQYNNSIPHDLIMRFYIADVPNSIFFLQLLINLSSKT